MARTDVEDMDMISFTGNGSDSRSIAGASQTVPKVSGRRHNSRMNKAAIAVSLLGDRSL